MGARGISGVNVSPPTVGDSIIGGLDQRPLTEAERGAGASCCHHDILR
jgi:hypothetical protein